MLISDLVDDALYKLMYSITKLEAAVGDAEIAGLDIAGLDTNGRSGKGGHCRTGQKGTVWQLHWTLSDRFGRGGHCRTGQ